MTLIALLDRQAVYTHTHGHVTDWRARTEAGRQQVGSWTALGVCGGGMGGGVINTQPSTTMWSHAV